MDHVFSQQQPRHPAVFVKAVAGLEGLFFFFFFWFSEAGNASWGSCRRATVRPRGASWLVVDTGIYRRKGGVCLARGWSPQGRFSIISSSIRAAHGKSLDTLNPTAEAESIPRHAHSNFVDL